LNAPDPAPPQNESERGPVVVAVLAIVVRTVLDRLKAEPVLAVVVVLALGLVLGLAIIAVFAVAAGAVAAARALRPREIVVNETGAAQGDCGEAVEF
jgi:hypothetical protein